jgi:hypothetical protein
MRVGFGDRSEFLSQGRLCKVPYTLITRMLAKMAGLEEQCKL